MNTRFLNYTYRPAVLIELNKIKSVLQTYFIKGKSSDRYNLFQACKLHHKARELCNMVEDLIDEVEEKAR